MSPIVVYLENDEEPPTPTSVSTVNGFVPISQVRIGDSVYAYDEFTGIVGVHTVVNTFIHDDDQIVYLTIDGEEVETTPWHPFYTDEGWEDAGDLQPGDLILSLDGDYGVVESIVIADETQAMYDLDVETVDTFAVGNGAWVVHNQNPCPLPQLPDGRLHKPNDQAFMNPNAANPNITNRNAATNELRNNMVNAGYADPRTADPNAGDWRPHHVVALQDTRAASARAILNRAGIDINSAANGVWMPQNLDEVTYAIENWGVNPIHIPNRHGLWFHDVEYYSAVGRRLREAEINAIDEFNQINGTNYNRVSGINDPAYVSLLQSYITDELNDISNDLLQSPQWWR